LEQTITALPERVRKSDDSIKGPDQDLSERADHLGHKLEVALEHRNRRTFSADARRSREQQFIRDTKAVMKDVTAAAGAGISDRRLRQAMRVQLYADLMVVTKRLNAEHARLANRARKAIYLSVAFIAGAGVVVIAAVLSALQSQ
jgi:hypothetical protein